MPWRVAGGVIRRSIPPSFAHHGLGQEKVMTGLRTLVALIAMFAAATAANATSVTSTNFFGSSYQGSASYNSSSKTLSIKLTNTSSSWSNKITGFVFNGADDCSTSYQSNGWNDKFKNTSYTNAGSHGSFNGGACIGGKFDNNNNNNGGIGKGESCTFNFKFSGSKAGRLSVFDCFKQLNCLPFLVKCGNYTDCPRWDKPPCDDTPVVPLPAASWAGMSMLGLLGVAYRFRRSRLAA
jgi:hypothetical protein